VRRRRGPTELGPLQVVGAWLGLWTPPRDAVVPPVPWRRLLLGIVLGEDEAIPPTLRDDFRASSLAHLLRRCRTGQNDGFPLPTTRP
jgi:hypothetical protein